MNPAGKIYFIGAGPGDPELITVKGLNLINRADLIIYAGSLVPRQLFSESGADRIIDSSGLTLEQTHKLMSEAYSQGQTAARVHTGDPSIFGTIQEQAALLQKEGIPFEIIPGVTASFAAAARAGISFTFPEVSQTLIITRASGRTRVPCAQSLKRLAASKSSMAIYLSATLAENVQSELLDGGLDPETLVIIGWKVGWADEKIIETDLANLPRTVKSRNISGQAVFLILPGKSHSTRSKLYDPDFSHGYRKPGC
ncbi:MAG: precorrin-4 C(11)-methyltransferase [Desulfonatronovibrio sp.]